MASKKMLPASYRSRRSRTAGLTRSNGQDARSDRIQRSNIASSFEACPLKRRSQSPLQPLRRFGPVPGQDFLKIVAPSSSGIGSRANCSSWTTRLGVRNIEFWRTTSSVSSRPDRSGRPRPANWWRFDAPERWNSASESQLAYLQRLNLLTEEEQERVRHVRPRLARARTSDRSEVSAFAQPLSPQVKTPAPVQTPPSGWQFLVIDGRVELVRAK